MFDRIKQKAAELAGKAEEFAGDIQGKVTELTESFGKTVTIEQGSNFVHILAMKVPLPSGPCFDGGKPVETLMIDYFYPLDQVSNRFPLTIKESDLFDKHQQVAEFVKDKPYYREYSDKGYIIMGVTNYGYSFLI